MDYDFIEIGTSDFDTLIELASDDTIGISIEPLQVYLDNLPDKKNVVKLNAAMSADSSSDNIEIYYIPPNVIDENNLEQCLRGCNKIGSYHPLHLSYDLTRYVKIDKVKQITFNELYNNYNIHKVQQLKIDTEGFDCHILQQFLIFLKDKDTSFYPKKITFETNTNTDINFIHQTIRDFLDIGYTLNYFNYGNGSESTELVYNSQ